MPKRGCGGALAPAFWRLPKVADPTAVCPQEHYPERLRAVLLVGTPGIFYATWRLIKPWLDPVTAAKVHFLPSQSDAQAAALLQHVDAAVLPACYGGALQAGDMPVPGLKGEPTVVVLDAAGQPVTAAAKTGN